MCDNGVIYTMTDVVWLRKKHYPAKYRYESFYRIRFITSILIGRHGRIAVQSELSRVAQYSSDYLSGV